VFLWRVASTLVISANSCVLSFGLLRQQRRKRKLRLTSVPRKSLKVLEDLRVSALRGWESPHTPCLEDRVSYTDNGRVVLNTFAKPKAECPLGVQLACPRTDLKYTVSAKRQSGLV